MSARLAIGAALLLTARSSAAGRPPQIQVEKATLEWSELKRLIESDGEAPPVLPTPTPPRHAYASTATIEGQIEDGVAALTVVLDVEVLADRWALIPVVPPNLSVASVQVQAPSGHRGLLVREASGVLLAANGPGHFHVVLEVEGPLDRTAQGERLRIPLPGLSGGQAHLTLPAAERPRGRTPWRTRSLGGGHVEAQAVLGAEGLDLELAEPEPSAEASGSVEGLSAMTVVSLGGSGVTRLTFHATPSEGGGLGLTLPPRARLWKVFVDGRPLEAGRLASGDEVQLALRRPSDIELAYTFEVAPLGLRGRYRVELPRWPVPVRDAAWELWMPNGLHYSETQAALGPRPSCASELPSTRTPLTAQGQCFAFARSVLDPGTAYVEGAYDEPL